MTRANITDISILAMPMRTKFRQITTREVAIFKGIRWSEFSPFTEYPDQEAAVWLQSALSWANDPLPELVRRSIPVNATLPAVAPEEIEQTLSPFRQFKTVKVKVAEPGQSLAEDLARVRAVMEIYPSAKLRLDANGGFSVDQALSICQELDTSAIEYFEQPVTSIEEMKKLRSELQRKNISLKIAADELIRKASDPYLVAKEGAADIAVIKVQPLGGISKALQIANEIGIEVVVSSALETSIGLSQGLHLAGALQDLNYDCGLATASLLAGDVTDDPQIPVNGEIAIREVTPSPALLEKYQASPERRQWWLRRIERCLELLES